MASYFQRLWIERTGAAPSRDLISMMIHSDAMNHMSPQEFMGNLVLLIVGGNDTTRNSISGGVYFLNNFTSASSIFTSASRDDWPIS
jgi:cytochrome P450